MVRSRLNIGGSGSGKSEGTLTELVQIAKTREVAIVLQDPHGKLARDLMLQLVGAGLDQHVLYDEFSNFDRVLGGLHLAASGQENKIKAESENTRRIYSLMNTLWRASQRKDELLDHPMTLEYTEAATRIILFRKEPVPLRLLPYLFRPKHQICQWLVDTTTDEEARELWDEVISLAKRNSSTELEKRIGGAKRLAKTVFNLPPFRERCVGNFDIGQALLKKKIIILDGSDDGSVPKEATTAIFGCVNLQIMTFLQKHFAQTGVPVPVLVVWEEAPAINAIGQYELDMLRELRKTGFAGWIIGQDLGFLDPEVKQAVKSCTPEHVWYNPGDTDLAKEAAEDLALAKLNPHLVRHEHMTERMVFDGYVQKKRRGVSKSDKGETISESDYEQAEYKPVVDIRKEFFSFDDQVKLDIQKLLTMDEGYRMIRTKGYVSKNPEYIPMLRNPWPEHLFPGCAAIKLRKAINRSQLRDEFTTPVDLEQTWTLPATTSSSQGTGTKPETNGSTFIPLPPPNSSKQGSTPPSRRRGKGSGKGKNGKS